MAFLTFGTGLGAGLILDGRLYRGACGMAGELGHWRLSDYGPTGYGKEGSFEGFCSGGGIRQLAETLARQRQKGRPFPWAPVRSRPALWHRLPERETRWRWRCWTMSRASWGAGWPCWWTCSTRNAS